MGSVSKMGVLGGQSNMTGQWPTALTWKSMKKRMKNRIAVRETAYTGTVFMCSWIMWKAEYILPIFTRKAEALVTRLQGVDQYIYVVREERLQAKPTENDVKEPGGF